MEVLGSSAWKGTAQLGWMQFNPIGSLARYTRSSLRTGYPKSSKAWHCQIDRCEAVEYYSIGHVLRYRAHFSPAGQKSIFLKIA